jgi:hypothetical protein
MNIKDAKEIASKFIIKILKILIMKMSLLYYG